MAISKRGTYGAALRAVASAKRFDQFHLKIFSPYETFYDGMAVSLTATNKTGPFDVLPGHGNFFSLLQGGQVLVNTGFQNLEFSITRGIIRVSQNNVTLFADI